MSLYKIQKERPGRWSQADSDSCACGGGPAQHSSPTALPHTVPHAEQALGKCVSAEWKLNIVLLMLSR